MTTPHRFTPREVEEMADALLKSGLHPNRVRHALKAQGVKWDYQFLGQGMNERIRRLRKQGMGLCPECRRDSFPLAATVKVCRVCLEKKWKPE